MVICSYNFNDRISNILRKIKENKMISLLIFLFLTGVIIGSISIGRSNFSFFNDIKDIFKQNFDAINENSYFITFSSSLVSIFIYIALIFLLSLSLWGGVIVPFLPFFRGIGIGITAGCLYLSYGIKGILFYVLVLLPGIFVSSAVLVFYTRKSIGFSRKLCSKIFPNSNLDKLWPEFKSYLKHTGISIVFCVVVALIDVLFNFLLFRFFNFS